MHAAVGSGCIESAQLMCGLSNHGVCRLPWKFTALWRCLVDGRALSTHAPLALERRTIHSDLSVGRRNLKCKVSGRVSHNQASREPRVSPATNHQYNPVPVFA